MWDRHDAADAIVALFDANVGEDDPTTNVAPLATALEDSGSGATTQNEEWIEEALCVVMDDGSQILLPVDDRVNVITRSADGVAIVQRFCRSLRVGEELLLVNGEHRRSLYDLLLSRVHRHPTIAPWLSLIEKWHDGLRRAFQEAKQRSGMTLESLLALLRARGSTITTGASVRGWVTGITLAPSDPHDIRRLGELFGLPIAMQYSREIRNAASRLKGLHINLSGRLNRWLESEGAGAAALSSDQSVVDAELGLTIDDFRHSLVRGRIASVDLVQGPFLSSHLGVLQRSVG